MRAIVRREVRGPDPVIDDACQSAWMRLLEHEVRREAALSWLVMVAKREAWKLTARLRRELAVDERAGDRQAELAAPAQIEQRELLAALGALPVRQQRLLWLNAFGFTYEELASRTWDSARTVERQLLRGRRAARQLADGNAGQS